MIASLSGFVYWGYEQALELRLQQGLKKMILRVFTTVTEDHSWRIVRMTLKQIAALGKKLVTFLGLFADCFGRREARDLLRVYVKGQLSHLHRSENGTGPILAK